MERKMKKQRRQNPQLMVESRLSLLLNPQQCSMESAGSAQLSESLCLPLSLYLSLSLSLSPLCQSRLPYKSFCLDADEGM